MQVETSDLIEELAKADIVASRSGFDSKRRQVWVEFASSDDAESLLNLMARYVPEGESLFRRIFGGGKEPRSWQYSVTPINRTKEEMSGIAADLNWKPNPRFSFRLYCLLPPEDLPIILELIRDYNGTSVVS